MSMYRPCHLCIWCAVSVAACLCFQRCRRIMQMDLLI